MRDEKDWAAKAALADAKGNTALMVAARKGEAAKVAKLLPWSKPDEINVDGQTALMLACKKGRAECAKLLAPASDVNRLDILGDTALIWALRAGSDACARTLLDDPRTNVSQQGSHRHSALIEAIRAAGKDGDQALVREIFLRGDASALMARGSKSTALMCAAYEGSLECVALMASACDPKTTDIGGASAIDLAARCGHWECVDFLAPRSDPERVEKYFKQGGSAKMPLWASRHAREEARQIWAGLDLAEGDNKGNEGGADSRSTRDAPRRI